MNIWTSYDYIDYINVDAHELVNLPSDINISTMCATCKLGTCIIIENVTNHLQLNENDILSIKINNNVKSLIKTKTKNKYKVNKNKTVKNYFYNQITIVMRIDNNSIKDIDNASCINIKIFKNGSLQMAGCKSITDVNIVLNKLVYRLKQLTVIDNNTNDNSIIDKQIISFVSNPDDLKISHFKIDMINSNYNINMQIDRFKLFELLNKKKIKCIYEPCIRACVNVKYNPNDNNNNKEISIFIFQKGNIIITGAKSRENIILTYKFINNILLMHKDDIIKINNDQLILDIYESIKKEIDCGLIKL